MFIARHGDLLIRQINELPKGLKEVKTNIVAEGEFTGHNHTVIVEDDTIAVFSDNSGKKYIGLAKDAKISHQEHKTLEIPCGYYEVIIEQEFDPFEQKIRQVKD
jgi:hypothetical protein